MNIFENYGEFSKFSAMSGMKAMGKSPVSDYTRRTSFKKKVAGFIGEEMKWLIVQESQKTTMPVYYKDFQWLISQLPTTKHESNFKQFESLFEESRYVELFILLKRMFGSEASAR